MVRKVNAKASAVNILTMGNCSVALSIRAQDAGAESPVQNRLGREASAATAKAQATFDALLAQVFAVIK